MEQSVALTPITPNVHANTAERLAHCISALQHALSKVDGFVIHATLSEATGDPHSIYCTPKYAAQAREMLLDVRDEMADIEADLLAEMDTDPEAEAVSARGVHIMVSSSSKGLRRIAVPLSALDRNLGRVAALEVEGASDLFEHGDHAVCEFFPQAPVLVRRTPQGLRLAACLDVAGLFLCKA